MKITLDESEFRFEWFSGTGAGGQYRNKHQNSCRCTHVPTGIRANGTQQRSREDNKRLALAACRSKIIAHFHKDKERNLAGDERVRTYHESNNMVIDHASGHKDTYVNVVDKGNIDEMIEERAKAKR